MTERPAGGSRVDDDAWTPLRRLRNQTILNYWYFEIRSRDVMHSIEEGEKDCKRQVKSVMQKII